MLSRIAPWSPIRGNRSLSTSRSTRRHAPSNSTCPRISARATIKFDSSGIPVSEIRYKTTLAISPEAAFGPAVVACLARVKEAHGAAGPWVVAGYRIGERARKDLGLPRHSHDLEVVHHCTLQVQYSCMADGLSAATGASPGKLNLRIEESSANGLKTLVRYRERGRTLTFTLKPEFIRSIADLPLDRLESEGRRVASLPDEAIFEVTDSK